MKPKTNTNFNKVLLCQTTSTINTAKFLVWVFPIQQWPYDNNIVAEKGLNLFDECAAEYVHLYPQEEEWTSSSWGDSKMYTPGTVANSQTDRQKMPMKINKNGAVAVLILCWCYFSSLQMYSEKFFNVYFYEQMFFEIFVAKGDTGQFFWKIIAWTVKFSLTNLHVSWRSWS